MKIADISKYQGNIDWEQASKELSFCILRASCGTAEDAKYAQNAEACERCGVPYHAYHYLKATDFDGAVSEAEVFYRATRDHAPLFYVVDCEYDAITRAEKLTAGKARSIVESFAAELRRLAGDVRVGCYIGHHLYKTWNLDYNSFAYVWIPRYGKNTGEPETTPDYPCDLWQYTSKGRVAGISGNVDLNKIIGDKPLSWFVGQKEDDMSETNRAQTPFTNEHFVEFLKKMLGSPYWYGTCIYKCTENLRSRKAKQYPSHYGSSRTARYRQDIADKKVCADCIGAAKGYAWTGGGQGVFEAIGTDKSITSKYGSNGCPDKGANSMFAYAKTKGMDWGAIGTIPEIPGLAVTFSGHVGYYIGGGEVIEFKGFNYGCVQTKLKNGKWTHWYKLPFIDYGKAAETPSAPDASEEKNTLGSRLLKRGSKGDDVTELQRILVKLGYDLGSYGDNGDGIDGDYGAATEKAVRKFQSVQQIQVDGKYGSITHAALMGVLADQEAGETNDPDEEPAHEEAERRYVEVNGTNVNVRVGPSTKYKVITRANTGDTFPFVATAENYGWHAIEINSKIGWICGDYATVKG
jgi:GH25 family lysozyme M1 (1,4-beta-N-acetylmuramidase)/peptidoglycan hydrolase-like protein with peptidoglycan-binding domain